MSVAVLILLGFITGLLVPLQLASNAQLARATANPLLAAFLVFLVGTLASALVLAASRTALPSISSLASVPPTAWLGGLIATGYIVAIVIVTPRLGVGVTAALIIVGQLLGAILMDHFGVFGNQQQTINAWRVAGLLLMVSGVIAIKLN